MLKRKAYFDTCIESGKVQNDLPPLEMAAVRSLQIAHDEGKIEIVTSRESHREQDRAKDLTLRAQLAESRGATAVVPNDHKLLGFHNQMGPRGTVAVTPMLTEIIDEELFKSLTAAGLKDADARHLMYAARNGCDWFVTTDRDFTSSRRTRLESLCLGLKIVMPSELAAELRDRPTSK